MSRFVMLCVLWMCVAVAEAQTGAQRADATGAMVVGKPMPELVLRGVDGKAIDLAKYRGKQAVYLKFWATWCSECVEQMGHFQHAQEQAGPSLAVIGVNAGLNDTAAVVRKFQRERHLTMPMAIDDGSAVAALNVRVTPLHVVIDRAGIVRFVGHLADQRVDAALAAVKTDTTQAAVAAAAPVEKTTRYALGERVATLQLQPLDAKATLPVPDATGRPTVLVFFSSWCESYLADTQPQAAARCQRSREQLTALPSELRQQAQWIWIAGSLWSGPAEARRYRDSKHIAAPVVLDEANTLFNTFDVHDMPSVLVLDGKGVLRQRFSGAEEDLQQQLRSALSR